MTGPGPHAPKNALNDPETTYTPRDRPIGLPVGWALLDVMKIVLSSHRHLVGIGWSNLLRSSGVVSPRFLWNSNFGFRFRLTNARQVACVRAGNPKEAPDRHTRSPLARLGGCRLWPTTESTQCC
jgi:hypothetical protein